MMRWFRSAIATITILASHQSNAAVQNQCLTVTPYRAVEEGTLAGMKRYESFRATQRSARSVKGFLDMVFSYGVSRKINTEIIEKTKVATKHLKWTGQKGGLIEILMQRAIGSDIPAELLGVAFLGGGECPFNVLTETMSKDQVNQAPRDGLKIDNDASFYVWVSIGKGGILQTSIVAPGSRGLIIDKVIGDKAAASVLASSANVREIDQLRSLVREIEKIEISEQVRRDVSEALKKREDANLAINSAEISLQRKLSDQASATQATIWIDSLDRILTFAKLVDQVRYQLSDAPKSTLDAIGNAKDKNELKNALDAYQKINYNSIEFFQNEKKVLIERLTLYRKTIIDAATKNGAPSSAVKLP